MGQPALAYTDEDFDDSWYDEEVWLPEPTAEEEPLILRRAKDELPQIPSLTPSQFTSRAFIMPNDEGTGFAPFSFEGRRHLPRIYDSPARL